jgi:hypothetical protein
LQVVRDLLQPAVTDCKPDGSTNLAGGLQIREDMSRGGKGVYVDGLAQVNVMGELDVLECLACGNANRMVGSTLMNAESSRSHALLTLTLQQKLADGSTKARRLPLACALRPPTIPPLPLVPGHAALCRACFPLGQVSKLNVADLAGSERVGKTGSSGETLDEAKKINASLSSLCMVIGALSEAKPHVPYRNSKLTRILQESLGGNSKTALLVTCSPAADNLHETTSSLRFARQAKKIQNVAVVNRVQSKAQLQADNLALQKELGEARAQLAAGGGGGAAGGAGKVLEGKALEAAAAPLLAEVAQLKMAAAAREGEAIQLQHELKEEQQAAVHLRAELAEHEADGKQLQATVARFQVLHGVAPTRVRESREGRALGGALDQLRRLLVEAEGQAMQRELSGADDESEAKSQAERLRGQLAQQHARIVELEARTHALGRRALHVHMHMHMCMYCTCMAHAPHTRRTRTAQALTLLARLCRALPRRARGRRRRSKRRRCCASSCSSSRAKSFRHTSFRRRRTTTTWAATGRTRHRRFRSARAPAK